MNNFEKLWRTGLRVCEPLIQLVRPTFMADWYQAPLQTVEAIAGGFEFELAVSKRFRFRAGQHVALQFLVNGRFVERMLTICSSPQELASFGIVRFAMRQKPNGVLSTFLQNVTPGSMIWLRQAQGDFQYQPQRPAFFLAAGSGITPFRAMLRAATRLTHPLTLCHLVPDATRAWFANEFQSYQQQWPLFKYLCLETSKHGRPSLSTLITPALEQHADIYFCGPQGLLQELQHFLSSQRWWQGRLMTESFGVTASSSGSEQPIRFHGRGQVVEVAGAGTLLQVAEHAGVNVTSGCRRGVCFQCLCQKTQGQVRNLLTGELSSFGSERIQLCVTEAVTPVDIQLERTGASL